MAQNLQPNGDISINSWATNTGGTTGIFEAINELTASSGDFIQNAENTNDSCEFSLTDPLSPVNLDTNHVIRCQYSKNTSGGQVKNLTINLKQGATVIRSLTYNNIADTWATIGVTITTGEAGNISNYNDLRLEFVVTGDTGGSPGARRRVRVSWALTEVPNTQLSPNDIRHAHRIDGVTLSVPEFNVLLKNTEDVKHEHRILGNIELTFKEGNGEHVELKPNRVYHKHIIKGGFEVPVNYKLDSIPVGHQHRIESTTIAIKYALAPNDIRHPHNIEGLILGVKYALMVADVRHTHFIDQTTLGVKYTLAPNNVRHGHSIEQVAMAVAYAIVVNDVAHEHRIDNVELVVIGQLNPQNVRHAHRVQNSSIAVHYSLVAQNVRHGHLIENVTLTLGDALGVEGIRHAHRIEGTSLAVKYGLVVNSVRHNHRIESVTFTFGQGLLVDSVRHEHRVDQPSLTVSYELVVNNVRHAHRISNVTFLMGDYVLIVQSVRHAHRIDNVLLPVEEIDFTEPIVGRIVEVTGYGVYATQEPLAGITIEENLKPKLIEVTNGAKIL